MKGWEWRGEAGSLRPEARETAQDAKELIKDEG